MYTKEFKLEMERSDKPASEVARELGLRHNQPYKWKKQLSKTGDVASSRRGRPRKKEQPDTAKLEAEVKRLREENEILKKAAVDSIDQCNRFTKILIFMSTFDETSKANIYTR